MLNSWFDRVDERLAAEDDINKMTLPYHLGADIAFADLNVDASLDDLRNRVDSACRDSMEFYGYKVRQPDRVAVVDNVLTFVSPIVTETAQNNLVTANLYRTKGMRVAAVLLPHWNAELGSYSRLSRCLAAFGVTIVEMALPYHGLRNHDGATIADRFLSPNLGLTIRSVRQAVLEVGATVRWLKSEGYEKVGVIGASLGSCIAALAAAHDEDLAFSVTLVTAGAFAEVVWTGRATRHIRSSLEGHIGLDSLRHVWSIISPETFVARIASRRIPLCVLIADRDKVVLPMFANRYVGKLKEAGCDLLVTRLNCGHYTIGMFPYNIMALLAVARFLHKNGQ